MQSDNNHNYNKNLQPNANSLRKTMTKAEACLWKYALRAGKMHGYSFRRQRPIGRYIADFACLPLMLVIEVDGITHHFEDVQAKDRQKEHDLRNWGYTVLRFTDEEVLKNINQVIRVIEITIEKLNAKNTNPPPTPASGG